MGYGTRHAIAGFRVSPGKEVWRRWEVGMKEEVRVTMKRKPVEFIKAWRD